MLIGYKVKTIEINLHVLQATAIDLISYMGLLLFDPIMYLINSILNFNPMVNKGSLSVKLALMPDHGMTRLSKGAALIKDGSK